MEAVIGKLQARVEELEKQRDQLYRANQTLAKGGSPLRAACAENQLLWSVMTEQQKLEWVKKMGRSPKYISAQKP